MGREFFGKRFPFWLVGWVNSRLENLQLKDEKIRSWKPVNVNQLYLSFIYLEHVEISMGDLAQKTSSENKWSQIRHDFHMVAPLAFTCVALRKCQIPNR